MRLKILRMKVFLLFCFLFQHHFGIKCLSLFLFRIILMLDKQQSLSAQLLSSNEEKPFVGKYHGVLRRNKPDPRQLALQNKKEYKKKKIYLKAGFWTAQSLRPEWPLSFHHIYNFHNILAINEHSLMDPDCQESFVTSKFYLKKIQKVTIQSNCLLFTLQDIEGESMPIPYICQRLKSMGNADLFQIAQSIEYLQSAFPDLKESLKQDAATIKRDLPCFLQQMKEKPFFSQYSPNLLIISGPFLAYLGYDMEELAVESVKFKTILKEFFSAVNYTQLIKKHLKNIELMKQYLEGKINLQEFCSNSLIVCSDYIQNSNNKKIQCKVCGATSKQLTPYIEIKELSNDQEQILHCKQRVEIHRQQIQQLKDAFKIKEIQILQNLTQIPKHFNPQNKSKICSYKSYRSPSSI